MKIKAKEKTIRKKNYMEGKTLQSTKVSIAKQATKHMMDLFRPRRLDKADIRSDKTGTPHQQVEYITRTYFIY